MKKIIPFFYLVLISGIINAQSAIRVSTSQKQTCFWSSSTSSYDQCGEMADYSSLFSCNANETMFTHVTEKMTSTYYVSEKKYLSSCNCESYAVTSDVGNKYVFILDLDNNIFKIISSGHSDINDDYSIILKIKRTWKE